MKNIKIEDIIPVLYKFYNKDLCDFEENNNRTKEQKQFLVHTESFYNKNYSKWLDFMNYVAEKYEYTFWDTTSYNRQSFSGYFFSEKQVVNFIMISSLLNVYYIDSFLNNDFFLSEISRKMKKILPMYIIMNKEDFNQDLKPYFKFYSGIDFVNFNLHEALFGTKPTL